MIRKKTKIFFVCGTDTGVGKTFVTGALIASLNKMGIRAGGFKPLESGCRKHQRHLRRADSLFLKKMGKMPEPLDLINPYYFEEALAPGVAAERKKTKISFELITKKLEELKKKYNCLFVEGAGGLLVPLSGKKTNLDLIKKLKTPVILVARLGLGTLNHTLLTLDHLKRNHVSVIGVILNQTTPSKTVAEKTNPAVLKKRGAPILGIVPYQGKPENIRPISKQLVLGRL